MAIGGSPAVTGRRRRTWRTVAGGLLILVGLLAWRAFTVEPRQTKPFLSGHRAIVLAHQGASGHAPANTMESLELGLRQGGDMLDLDVHGTADGEVVVSHDATIDRLTDGTGAIRSMTLAELRRYDFGYRFSPDDGKTFPFRGKGVQIPTLDEVFARFPGERINIEIKQTSPPIADKVWQLVRKHRMEENVLIVAFPSEPLRAWRLLAGEQTATAATVSDMYQFTGLWLLGLDRLYQPAVDAFQVPTLQRVGPVTIRFDTPRFIAAAHRLGVKVHYWTINDRETMRRLFALGADGIFTDYPDRAAEVLHELGLR